MSKAALLSSTAIRGECVPMAEGPTMLVGAKTWAYLQALLREVGE